MNEEAVKYAFDLFIRDGYKGDLDKFKKLLETNPEAFDYSFTLFERDGYKGGKDKYKALMGLGETAAPVATAEPTTTAATTTPAKTEPTKTEPTAPAKTEVVAEAKVEPAKELSNKQSEAIKVRSIPQREVEMPVADTNKMPPMVVREAEPEVKEEPKKEMPIGENLLPVTEKTEVKAVETPSDKMVIKSEKKEEPVKVMTEKEKEEWECPPAEGGCSKNKESIDRYFYNKYKIEEGEKEGNKVKYKQETDRARITDREGNLARFIDNSFDGRGVANIENEDWHDHYRYGGYYYIAEENPKSKRFSVYNIPVEGKETSLIYDNKTGIIMKETNEDVKNKEGKPMKTWLNVPFKYDEYQTLKAEIDKAKGGTTAPKVSTVPTLEPWQQPQGTMQVKEEPKKELPVSTGLTPITEKTVIKEVPTDTGKMTVQSPAKKRDFLEAADEVLYRIYNSPGYLKKLENEIVQSRDFNKDYDPKVLEGLEEKGKDIIRRIRSSNSDEDQNTLMQELSNNSEEKRRIYEKISLIGGKYNTAELANERKKRVETTDVTLSEDDSDTAGYMRRYLENEEPTANSDEELWRKQKEFSSKEQPIKANISINPPTLESDMYKTGEYPAEDYRSDLMATAIEEKEHSAHIPMRNPGGLGGNIAENITPYAVDVVKENAIIDDDYLTEPTEVIAKKRATEVNLIGRELLKPGENVDESHFKELLKSADIPFNVVQLLQAVSGIKTEEESAVKSSKEVREKILNDPKMYKEALERWLNIMNKIAFSDKKSFQINPFEIKTG